MINLFDTKFPDLNLFIITKNVDREKTRKLSNNFKIHSKSS